jgi:transposase
MDVVHRKSAGIDVHAKFVAVCGRVQRGSKVCYEDARFATTTAELLSLKGWLEARGITHVVMEATGVYWKPVWHLLEGPTLSLTLANAHAVRNMPGRKSDTSDARWLADLLAHGLVRASFVPPAQIRELRDLTRSRQQLSRQQVQHQNRIGKVLEDANIKLGNVVSDLLGVNSRRILKAMIAGETDPGRLAGLVDRRLKATREELMAALDGRFTRHHAFLLRRHLATIDHLAGEIAAFDREVDALLAPFRDLVRELRMIPGVKDRAVRGIIAEIGLDMSCFPTSGHLLSWARVVPRMDETGGHTRSRRIKQGGAWLKPLVVQCAYAAARTKNTDLSAQFASISARRGAKKAAIAVAASILTAIYHMIRDGVPYRPPVKPPLDGKAKAQRAARLAADLRSLGYAVEVRRAA